MIMGWKASYVELTEFADDDVVAVGIDISDTTMAATGTTKWAAISTLRVAMLQGGTTALEINKAGSDATDYERGSIGWNGDLFQIAVEKGGEGLDRTIRLASSVGPMLDISGPGSTTTMQFYRPNTGTAGGFMASTNSTFTIGLGGSGHIGLGATANTLDLADVGFSSYRLQALRSASARGTFTVSGGDVATNRDVDGHHLRLRGGNSSAALGTDHDGGNLYLSGGDPKGAGDYGLIIFENLQTSDPGVAGALWLNGGAPAISAGA